MIIYKITNLINNKLYIGQTTRCVEKRWKQHFYRNSAIGNALRKYGKDNFKFEIIKRCKNLQELNQYEEKFIQDFDTLSPAGYNLAKGGLNKTLHEETKIKIGKKHKGKKLSIEQKEKFSKFNKGKKFSKEHRSKISKALIGRTPSQGTRQLWSKIRKNRIFGRSYPVIGTKGDVRIELFNANAGKSMGFNPNHIRACCRGERKLHGGYTWVRVGK